MFSKWGIRAPNCLMVVLSSAFLAFGLYNVHSLSGVTEGGVLGMTLLLEQLFSISPSVSGFVLNGLCYLAGWRMLGRSFLIYSALSTLSFSAAYGIFEQFEPLWPQLAQMPLAAAVLGALFVGLGAGVCVRCGGATGGDDALAMSIHAASGVGVGKNLSPLRPDRAGPLPELHSPGPHRVLGADGGHLRPGDRAGAAPSVAGPPAAALLKIPAKKPCAAGTGLLLYL